jgi:hypothetical protein
LWGRKQGRGQLITVPVPVSVPRQVEEIFENYLPTLDLHVNGRAIRTTAEHPFWVRGHGWVDAHQFEPGDQLRTRDGRWLEVERIDGPMPSAPVYNMCVQEYHTYFVGHQIWGFAAWSHNACLQRGRRSGRPNAPNAPSRQAADLPSLDSTGKVHGLLPHPDDFGQYQPDELAQLQRELKQSVQERIRQTAALGRDRGHGQRQGAEQDLINTIAKYLSGS